MKHINPKDLYEIIGRLTKMQGADWLLEQLIDCLSNDELEQNLAYIVDQWNLDSDFPELKDIEY